MNELRGKVGAFKVGLQLFTSAGPEFVRELTDSGLSVFLDLKFHDIPNTVAKAAIEAARLGVWMLNVHALGGLEMMLQTQREIRKVCQLESRRCPILLGVTVLTSFDQKAMNEIGVSRGIDEQVDSLTALTAKAGFDGVVASAREVAMIRRTAGGKDLLIVTPGIRAISATNDDQKRVMSFGEAVAAGADYVVVGRPVIEAENRLAALEMLLSS